MKDPLPFHSSIFVLSGKSTGIVTTSRITHATPAAAYAKIPHRNWESDADLTKYNVSGRCRDIAQQLIYNNSEIDVISYTFLIQMSLTLISIKVAELDLNTSVVGVIWRWETEFSPKDNKRHRKKFKQLAARWEESHQGIYIWTKFYCISKMTKTQYRQFNYPGMEGHYGRYWTEVQVRGEHRRVPIYRSLGHGQSSRCVLRSYS